MAQSVKEATNPNNSVLYNSVGKVPVRDPTPVIDPSRWRAHHADFQGTVPDDPVADVIVRSFMLSRR